MGARLRVFLTQEEEQTLWELRADTTVPQRVKDRAEAVRLSHQGWYVEKIASHMHWHIETVRKALKRWQQGGLEGLWDAPRPGKEPRWQEADMEYLETCLREEERTYNSIQLAEKLKHERQVSLSPEYLRQVLQKRG